MPDDNNLPAVSGRMSGASMREVGVTGLDQNSGYIFEEKLPQLKGRRALKVYREMSDNDSMVGGVLFAIDMSMRKAIWRFRPADGDENTDLADFANECLHDMEFSWDETLSEILTMLPFGFSLHELVYKRRAGGSAVDDPRTRSSYSDNRIGWRKWAGRSQETIEHWIFDESDGRLRGALQMAPPNYRQIELPMEKMALFRPRVWKDNPEGRSILRTVYRDWYYKSRIQEIEGIGIERDLAGLPVGWVPYRFLTENATDDEKSALGEMKKILTSIRRDDQEAVIWPLMYDVDRNKMFDLTLLSTGGQRQFDTDQIVNRYDARIAMSVLADFILLGHAKVGTNATSVSKIDLFTTALRAWMDVIKGVIDRQVTPRLMQVNGFDVTRTPKIEYSHVEQTDLRELGDLISSLAGAGMPLFPDENLENWIRDTASMPPKGVDDPMFDGQGDPAEEAAMRRRNHTRLDPSAFRDGHGDEKVPEPGDASQARRPGR